MKKILLVITFLATGAGAFHAARQHATQLQQKVQAVNESWQIHTQQLAVAQSEQIALTERIRELRETLAQSRPVTENALWTALQTNRADRLSPELRQRVLAELGFNWKFSPDFVVVSKQAVRDLQMRAVYLGGELADAAATVLTLTSAERGQVEAALQRVERDFKDWVLSHVERGEPANDVLAHYTLPQAPAMSQSISNSFAAAITGALGHERAELILPTAQDWMKRLNLYDCDDKPMIMIVRRSGANGEARLTVEVSLPNVRGGFRPRDLLNSFGEFVPFPEVYRIVFPNGWADVAKREGFELPADSEKKE